MRTLFHFPLGFALAAVLIAAASPTPDPVKAALLERDAAFFDLYFLRCDPAKVSAMVMPDLEFYHDRGGFAFASGKAFVADYQKSCAARQKPDAWRSRRELVAASFAVHPIKDYGAMTTGDHLFYERKGDGPEKLVGQARFMNLWRNDKGVWKLARVFSYDHGPAGGN
jgi:Domain of unknown function (DUF4440)